MDLGDIYNLLNSLDEIKDKNTILSNLAFLMISRSKSFRKVPFLYIM